MADVARSVLESRVRNPKVARQVFLVCAQHHCGGDYRLMERFVQRDFYGIPMDLIEKLRRTPSGGTIGRRYREVVHDAITDLALAVSQKDLVAAEEAEARLKVLLPSKETLEKRMKNEVCWREYYSLKAKKKRNLWDFEVLG